MGRAHTWIIAALLVLIALPTALELARTPAGYTYTWESFGASDYYTYLNKMKQGHDGAWLYVNQYTHEPTRPQPIFTFYLALGHAARWLGLSLPVAFHLSRLLLAALALALLWALLRAQVRDYGQRCLALVLAVFAAGFGFLAPRESLPWAAAMMPGPHLLMALLVYPHYLADFVALAGGWLAFAAYQAGGGRRHLLAGAVLVNLLVLNHPFLILPALLVPALWALLADGLSRRTLAFLTCQGLAALPLLALYLTIFYLDPDPALSAWRQQAVTQTLPPLGQLTWFGAVGLLALWGGWLSLAHPHREGALFTAWLAVIALLINLPLTGNPLEYAFFASVPVGAQAARAVWPLLTTRPRRLAATLLFTIGCTASLARLVSPTLSALHPDPRWVAKKYWPPGYSAGVAWLAEQTPPGAVVLAPADLSLRLPFFTAARPFVGHESETLGYEGKRQRLEAFWQEGASRLPGEAGVRYVVDDRRQPGPWNRLSPTDRPYLTPVFTSPDLVIFAVAAP